MTPAKRYLDCVHVQRGRNLGTSSEGVDIIVSWWVWPACKCWYGRSLSPWRPSLWDSWPDWWCPHIRLQRHGRDIL